MMMSTARWQPTKTRICKYNKLGKCARGEDCLYAHDRDEQKQARSHNAIPKTCKFFPKGECKFGRGCTKLHINPEEAPPALPTEDAQKPHPTGPVIPGLGAFNSALVRDTTAAQTHPTEVADLGILFNSGYNGSSSGSNDTGSASTTTPTASPTSRQGRIPWADMQDQSDDDEADLLWN